MKALIAHPSSLPTVLEVLHVLGISQECIVLSECADYQASTFPTIQKLIEEHSVADLEENTFTMNRTSLSRKGAELDGNHKPSSQTAFLAFSSGYVFASYSSFIVEAPVVAQLVCQKLFKLVTNQSFLTFCKFCAPLRDNLVHFT